MQDLLPSRAPGQWLPEYIPDIPSGLCTALRSRVKPRMWLNSQWSSTHHSKPLLLALSCHYPNSASQSACCCSYGCQCVTLRRGGSQKAQYSPYRHPPKLFHQPFKVQRLLQAMAISSTSPLSQCHHDEAQQCRASVTRPLISVCYTSPLLMTQSQNRSVVTTMTPITVN